MSGHRPKWRLPFHPGPKNPAKPSKLFFERAAKSPLLTGAPQCEGTARHTGVRCRMVAMRGARFCCFHGGQMAAEKAEAERYGRPVIRIRKHRNIALAARGVSEPWPEGLPKRPDFLELGPLGRGRLFEAWENRHTAPDVWEYELRPRYRKK